MHVIIAGDSEVAYHIAELLMEDHEVEARMARVQLMGEESIPRGVGGGPHTSAMGAADSAGARPSRGADGQAAPAWMRPQ